MAQFDPDVIYKALRMVPEFDGNPHVLTRFINLCDQIVAKYISIQPGDELNNLSLMNGILNKITGPASTIINSNGIPDNWLGIRNVLINNFADQRDETALYNDLSLATQGNKTQQEFYDHCQNLFSMIMTYVTLHEDIPTTIEAKRTLYKKLTMQAYVRGLKEPLGSRIRCMRPESIEKAHEFVQEEMNILYLQQRNDGSQKTHPTPHRFMPPPHMQAMAQRPFSTQNPMPSWPTPVVQRSMQNPMQPSKQPFQFAPPQQPPPFRPKPYQLQQPQFRMPTRTQQIFGAPLPNYNPGSKVFRLPPRNQEQYPKPMSGVSFSNPRQLPPTPGNNPFRPQVNFNEFSGYPNHDYYYDQYTELEYTDNNDYTYNDFPDYMTNETYAYEAEPNQVQHEDVASTSQEQDFYKSTKSTKPG